MSQLPLQIVPRLSYSAENFFLHSGVASLYEQLSASARSSGFTVAYVMGAPRSGKTHLSIRLSASYAQHSLYPKIIEGAQFATFITQQEQIVPEQQRYNVVIVDDAHRYFDKVTPGGSGPFVNFVERLRKEQGTLIFLSGKELVDLPCDEHIRSRLIPGAGSRLEPPATDDLGQLIEAMARQRGLSLTPRKVQFLVVRVGRSVAAIEEYLDRLTHLSSTLGSSIKFPLLSDAM